MINVYNKYGNLKVTGTGGSGSETDPIFTAWLATPPNISIFTNNSGYLTSTGITPAALTKTDDTNVTLTLGGTPAIALLQGVSLTLGWAGTLADARITSASTWNAKQAALSGTGIVKSVAGTISYLTDNSTNWDTAYTNRITSLTVTGSSGAATLISNVLNIPTYTLVGLGGTTLAAVNAQNLSVFAATTSAQLAGVISDETGTNKLVFSDSPTLVTPTLGAATGTSLVLGGTLAASALFDVQSTTKGLLIPRMTTTQRNAISSPATELLVSDTTLSSVYKYNGTEWEEAAAKLTDAVKAMQLGGSPFIAETVGMNSSISIIGSTALGSGSPGYNAIYINKRTTLTGAAFFQVTQGNFTGNNVNSIGLYSYSAGTITKIAETANDPNIWKNTANTFVQVPFSSTIAVAAGIYFLAVSYSSSAQTTAPAIGRGNQMISGVVNSAIGTNSFKLYSFRSGQTSLPSTESMSNLTANTSPFYLAVY